MEKPVTTRLPEEFIVKIKDIARREHIDMSTAIRKLLSFAITDWKKEYALKEYARGSFSFGQAASFAEVSVWDFPMLLKEHNVSLNYDMKELQRELQGIGWKKK